MCGRFQFTADDPDERIAAILDMLERTAPGQYTLGEIGPGAVRSSMSNMAAIRSSGSSAVN